MRRQRRRQRRHLAAEQRGVAGLVAVGHDHHAGARMDHPRGVPAIEGLQAFADPGAAAGALRHDRRAGRARAPASLSFIASETWASRVWNRNASASRNSSSTPWMKRRNTPVYMLIEPEASSSTTSRSGLSLAPALDQADRHAAMADIARGWCAAGRAGGRAGAPGRAGSAACAWRLREPRRDLVGLGDLGRDRRICGNRLRPDCRRARRLPCGLRRARSSGASSGGRHLIGGGLAPARARAWSCRLFSDGLLAALAEPMVSERDRTRLPSQNASNSPSNCSQSDLRAENRCLNAERSSAGRSGIARRHQRRGVLAFLQADRKAVVAQRLAETPASFAATRRETSSISS